MYRSIPIVALFLSLMLPSQLPCVAAEMKVLNVFILAGQSNMAGADSTVPEPPGFQQTAVDRATLFTSAPLPDGEKSKHYVPWGDVHGHRFWDKLVHGPEVGLSRSLHEDGWRNVALIKVYANYGRSARTWPWGQGGHLFKAWTQFVDDRLDELKKRGHSIRVCGFVWHQGIDDAIHDVFGQQHEQNLSQLIAVLRERYATKKTPFVLARSVNSRIALPNPDPEKKSGMAAVRRAQMQIRKRVDGVAWINVDDLPNVNTHHFTATGQLVIGRRFGATLKRLRMDAKDE